MIKRYKIYRWLQYILLALSAVACVTPIIISVIKLAPKMKATESKIALGGVAVFFAALALLIIFRAAVKKFVAHLPYTLTALVTIGIFLIIFMFIKKIIDDAITVFFMAFIGCCIGLIIELGSIYCKAEAGYIKDLYRRDK